MKRSTILILSAVIFGLTLFLTLTYSEGFDFADPKLEPNIIDSTKNKLAFYQCVDKCGEDPLLTYPEDDCRERCESEILSREYI